MRQTLVYYRRANSRAGFTLLELLLVVTIISLLAAVSAPALVQSIESAQQRAEIEKLQRHLNAQPRTVVRRGKPLKLTSETLAFVVSKPYKVSLVQPIVYQSNGMTDGGEVQLIDEDNRVLARFTILQPSGHVVLQREQRLDS